MARLLMLLFAPILVVVYANPASDLSGALIRFMYADGTVQEVVALRATALFNRPLIERPSGEHHRVIWSSFDGSILGWREGPRQNSVYRDIVLNLQWSDATKGTFSGSMQTFVPQGAASEVAVAGTFVMAEAPRSAPAMSWSPLLDDNEAVGAPSFFDTRGAPVGTIYEYPPVGSRTWFREERRAYVQIPKGDSVEIRARFEGRMPMWQQWYHDGVPLGERTPLEPIGERIVHNFGTGSVELERVVAVLRIDDLEPEDAGLYEVVVSNHVAAVPSFWPARLSVGPRIEPPRIVGVPASPFDLADSLPNIMEVEAEGQDLRYQWYKDYELLPDEDERVLRIVPDRLDHRSRNTQKDGVYRVKVFNGQGAVLSEPIEAQLSYSRQYPHITADPEFGQVVHEGNAAEFRPVYRGEGNPLVRWSRNGKELLDVAGKALRIENASSVDQGLYGLHVEHRGVVTSNIVSVDVFESLDPPTFLEGPGPPELRLAEGSPIELRAVTRGVDMELLGGRLQWYKDGVPLEGKTERFLHIWEASPGDAGTYTVRAWSSLHPDVEAISPATTVTLVPRSRLTNLSTRAWIGTGSRTLIGGVVIVDGPVRVLVRGLGPSLAELGVSGVLPDPRLIAYDSAGRVVTENDDWSASPVAEELEVAAAVVGARPLAHGSRDAALLMDLAPGPHTFHVSNKPGQKGIGMVEVFLVPESGRTGRFSNLSARAFARSGEQRVIGGLVLEGTAPSPFLVRAIATMHLEELKEILLEPRFDVFEGSRLIESGSTGARINGPLDYEERMESLFARLGAAPIPYFSDPAEVVSLRPGPNTVHVYNDSGLEGLVVLEIYDPRP